MTKQSLAALNTGEVRLDAPLEPDGDRALIERFIAEGGMAWVFRVNDPDLFDAPRASRASRGGASSSATRRLW